MRLSKSMRWIIVFGMVVLSVLACLYSCSGDPQGQESRPAAPGNERSVSNGRGVPRSESLPVSSDTEKLGPQLIDVRIRDLADGSSVPNVEFTAELGDRASVEPLVSDADGVVHVPEKALALMRPVGSYHIAREQSAVEILAAKEIWVYRSVSVSVFVETTVPVPDDTKTSIETWVCAGEAGVTAGALGPPWGLKWLEDHKLSRQVATSPAILRTHSVIEMPRVRGLAVVARVAGMRPVIQRLIVDGQTTSLHVSLLVSPSQIISGRLLDSAGFPLQRVTIEAYCQQLSSYVDTDYEPLQSLGHGVTCIRSAKDNTSKITYVASTETDTDGRYSIELNVDGEVMLQATPKRYAVVRRVLGMVTAGARDIDLTAGAQLPTTRVTISRGNKPLVGASVMIADVAAPIGQPVMMDGTRTDSAGSLEVPALELNHRYYVLTRWRDANGVGKSHDGFLVWAGQVDINVDALAVR